MDELFKDLTSRIKGLNKENTILPSGKNSENCRFSPAEAIQVFTKAIHSSFKRCTGRFRKRDVHAFSPNLRGMHFNIDN